MNRSSFISPRPRDRRRSRHRNLLPLRPFAVGTISFLLLSSPISSTTAQEASAPRTPDFSTFQLLTERNIFNPNRSSRTARAENRPAPRNPQVDHFTLVGTLGDGEQWTAFFDGTRSELRGRLRQEDSIGGYTLSVISNAGVQLDDGTNRVQLRVGMQLRRADNGPWLVAEREADSPVARPDPPNGNSTSADSASTASDDNDVLQRLRQKRERELQ